MDAADVDGLYREAHSQGLLEVRLPRASSAWRGRLAMVLTGAIEATLEREGACAPGVGAAVPFSEALSDQLYRARLVERRGLALLLPPLAALLDASKTLDCGDSGLLRFLLEASARLPLKLWIARENANIEVYGPPRPLLSFCEPRQELPSEAAPESIASAVSEPTAAEPPPAVVEQDGALEFVGSDSPQALETNSASEVPSPVEATGVRPRAAREPEGAELAALAEAAPPRAPRTALPSSIGDLAQAVVQSLSEPQPSKRARPRDEAPVEIAPRTVSVPPLYPNAQSDWRGWLADLLSARGPKPLAAIERMFSSSYVPLRTAALHGYADADAVRALDAWSESFAQSYHEAFDALRVRGKRPTMVLDVPELALRIGRLHGARSVQLVLVDGMRFDLGLRVEQRVRALLDQQAALAERLLLWAALPTTTEAQIELIGRGSDGLREPITPAESELPVARGRSATTLRRVKAGHRDLLKLDVVEARLAETGPREATRLDQIADETALALADHMLKQMPRTLVFAFGDHGFLLDALEDGTAAARRGGTTPEEVLVPAFAWLVGGVH